MVAGVRQVAKRYVGRVMSRALRWQRHRWTGNIFHKNRVACTLSVFTRLAVSDLGQHKIGEICKGGLGLNCRIASC